MKKLYDDIFKFDTKQKARVWRMEQEGSKHRTIAGIKDGNLVTSEWTQCEATNVGRANERTPVQQATFEIEAAYVKKLTREYHPTLEAAGGGAHFFKPMLAEKYEEFAPGYAQPKLDGIRCIAKIDGLWSRQGKPIMGAPHVFEALLPLFKKDALLVLDGELYNHDYKDDFNTIVSFVKKQKPDVDQLAESAKLVQYHVYDMPSHAGKFSERTHELARLVAGRTHPALQFVETIQIVTAEEFDEQHGRWLVHGYEGSMWRDNAPYEQKRSKTLRKRKEFQDAEYPISRIIEGIGNWAGYAKAVEYILPGDKRLENGERPRAGIKGNQNFTRELLVEANQYKQVTVKFFALTPDGIPRFPVATQFHGEKRVL